MCHESREGHKGHKGHECHVGHERPEGHEGHEGHGIWHVLPLNWSSHSTSHPLNWSPNTVDEASRGPLEANFPLKYNLCMNGAPMLFIQTFTFSFKLANCNLHPIYDYQQKV